MKKSKASQLIAGWDANGFVELAKISYTNGSYVTTSNYWLINST